ncbi:hypothetical protein [Streptomyces radicis]|uniref:HEAT repeat domain-containing protein n=1 Tax=Streptomyces radicis TaxID=1750517 RepID=A0A3A9W1Y6_9ACTN|nr:hypothetical protein [Streptomyces radicis]RKN06980.1 hypothetical protein D7319_19980 [Streptomyces radicis]RKN15880.1 hypothetical protein D7318_26815 [Streptomyces radicis]
MTTMAPVDSPAALRAAYDHLPFPARMRALALHARALDDAAYAALADALRSPASGTDDRLLALHLAAARRDIAAVAAALAEPALRRRALAVARRLPVPDEAFAALVLDPARDVRRNACRVLRLARRPALAERLLPEVRERYGPGEAAHMLPACAPDVIEAWLPRLGDAVPATVLHRLARSAPLALARHIASPERPGEPRPFNVYRLAALIARRDVEALLVLAAHAPEAVAGAAGPTLLRAPRTLLGLARGGATLELTLPDRPLPRAARRALRGLGPEELDALIAAVRLRPAFRHGEVTGARPDPLLALLPPERRLRVVEARLAARNVPPVAALAALPAAARADLVRPLLAAAARRPATARAELTALLPWSEGKPLLRELAESHRTADREAGWFGLLTAARAHGDPEEFGRVAASAERAWHDQESVRRAALRAAAGAGGRMLAAVPFAALRDGALTTAQSGDSTAATLSAAGRWVRRTAEVAARDGDMARVAALAPLLASVLGDARRPAAARLSRVSPALAPALWAAVDPAALGDRRAVSLAEALVEHGDQLPGFEELLARIATGDGDPGTADRAARAWLAAPATREERCALLLAARPAAIALPVVRDTVATRRTDLVGAFTAPEAPPRWVPTVSPSAMGRWLPGQRASVHGALAAIAADEEATLRSRTDAVTRLADRDRLLALAADAPQPVAAAALAGLARLAEVRGPEEELATFLAHAGRGGVRGRAAMAAARRLLRNLPDAATVALLGPLVRDTRAPVGTRKEAVRALAAVRGEAAFDALLAAWDAPGQHRDVRVALVPPLLARFQTPDVAVRLSEGLAEAAVRSAVVGGHKAVPPGAARESFGRLLVGLLRDEDPAIAEAGRHAFKGAHREMVEPASEELAEVALAPSVAEESRRTAAEVLGRLAEPGSPCLAAVRRVLDGLAQQAEAQGELAAEGSGRRFLPTSVGLLHRLAADTYRLSEDAQDALTDALLRAGRRRAAARLCLRLAEQSLQRNESRPDRWLRCLELAAGHPLVLSVEGGFHVRAAAAPPTEAALDVLAALRKVDTTEAGLLQVSILASVGRSSGWAEPWAALLGDLAAGPDPDVAEEAGALGVRVRLMLGG